MKITKYKKKNQNEYLIYFDNETSISIYEDTIIEYNLLVKKDIDDKTLKEIILYNQKYVAYYQALKDITLKLRTEKELKTRLKKKSLNNESINFAIQRLKKQGYLNDDVYLKAYLNDQVNLTFNGPIKIKNDLKKLGFKEEQVSKYLNKIEKSIWLEKIEKVIAKKEKANHNLSNYFLKIKIAKDLRLLGYEPTLINSIIDEYVFQDEKEILAKEKDKLIKKYQNKYSEEELKKVIKNKLYQKGFFKNDIDLDN